MEERKTSITDTLKELVDTYHSVIGSNDIAKLLEIQGELSVYAWKMADVIKDSGLILVDVEHNRKVIYNTELLRLKDTVKSVKYAEMSATLQTANLRIDEKKQEMIHKSLRDKMYQANKISDHLTMVISYLKKEQEQARFQT